MRVLAISRSQLLDTETGEVHEPGQLGHLSMSGAGGILVGCNLYNNVGRLNETFTGMPGWTIQIQSKERRLVRGTGRLVIGSFLPVYFGWVVPKNSQSGGRNGRQGKITGRIFHCMDLTEIVGVRECDIPLAMDHALSILQLCEARGVKFTANKGGLASRLLKASPHWETGRRAAPRFVNDHARKYLPGNYYGLSAIPKKNYKGAIYVDQISSHHNVAFTTPVPHPHYVRARGSHKTLHRPWIMGNETERMNEFFESHIGLVAGMVSIGSIPDRRKHLYPPFMHTAGRRIEFFYTNEREYFDGRHGTLEWIVAAWTADRYDPVVQEYAGWALNSRNAGQGRKPLLLAAYGALAQRTDRPLTLYLPWRGQGMRSMLPGAGPMLEKVRPVSDDKPQPRMINVLARGIIEAETRKRSIMYARILDSMRIPVLSVYVDGLILGTDRLPFLPEGWEVEAHLTNLQFQHPTHWTADEMRKQPGIPSGARSPAESARLMMQAGLKPSAEGIARRARKRREQGERMAQAAVWRERQGVLV